MPANGEYLNKYCRDITNEVIIGNILPVVGRNDDIDRILKILSQDNHNNLMLVGEPGVGKTSIIEGLAHKLYNEKILIRENINTIFELKPSNISSGAGIIGEWQERLQGLLNDLLNNRHVMLFIDEIHTLVGAGTHRHNETEDYANFLKTYLTNGQITFLGATTTMEYEKYIMKDPAFARRFNKFILEEPNKENTLKILNQVSRHEEIENNIIITKDSLEEIYSLANKYVLERKFPDKGIELLKESAASIKKDNKFTCDDITKIIDEHLEILSNEVNSIEKLDFNNIAKLIDDWFTLRKNAGFPTLTKEVVRKVISTKTGINIADRDINVKEKINNAQKCFDDNIIGQKKAIEAICNSLKRMFTGIRNEDRPIGSFLFLGPSGVGKTEIAKTLALILWGDKKKFIRYDMSEINRKEDLLGYSHLNNDYEKKGRLIKDIQANPFSVILFDEIEKAKSMDIYDIFLQILDEGYVSGADGKKALFGNAIIVMTSNLGAEILNQQILQDMPSRKIGFVAEEQPINNTLDVISNYEMYKKYMVEILKHRLRPELVNRIDEIVLFHHLTEDDLEKIFNLTFNEYKSKIEKNNNITMKVTQSLIKHIVETNFDASLGARPIRRAIEQTINTRISELLIDGKIQAGQTALFDLNDSNIICKVE